MLIKITIICQTIADQKLGTLLVKRLRSNKEDSLAYQIQLLCHLSISAIEYQENKINYNHVAMTGGRLKAFIAVRLATFLVGLVWFFPFTLQSRKRKKLRQEKRWRAKTSMLSCFIGGKVIWSTNTSLLQGSELDVNIFLCILPVKQNQLQKSIKK